MELVHYAPTEQIIIPPFKYLGVGIAPGSDVGCVFARGGRIIGPGSPLLISGTSDHTQVFRSTAYPGTVMLAFAKDADDLSLLCRPRPARYKLFSGTTGAGADTALVVPYNGRERFYGVVQYSGAGTPAGTVQTRLRHYYDATNYDEDTLNSRTEATLPETLAAGFEETERGDEMSVVLNFDVAVTYRLHTWTHDAGT